MAFVSDCAAVWIDWCMVFNSLLSSFLISFFIIKKISYLCIFTTRTDCQVVHNISLSLLYRTSTYSSCRPSQVWPVWAFHFHLLGAAEIVWIRCLLWRLAVREEDGVLCLARRLLTLVPCSPHPSSPLLLSVVRRVGGEVWMLMLADKSHAVLNQEALTSPQQPLWFAMPF